MRSVVPHVLVEIAREAVGGLVRNRTRTGLSMLGISWGIVSVVVLLAYGDGFNQALQRGFAGAFGDGVSVAFAGQTSLQAGGERAGRRVRFRLAEAEAVGEAPFVKAWSPEAWPGMTVAAGPRQANYLVRGVYPDYAQMRAQPRRKGGSSTPRTSGSSDELPSSAPTLRSSCLAPRRPSGRACASTDSGTR